ncbi:MAG: hypothetical protein H0X62_10990 [Bacteroidetes bacterium]|nr:hypothetical protein [Bacteroidota bacterium]
MSRIFYILLFINVIACAQEFRFTGVVKDSATLAPVPFVNILFEHNVPGYKNGSITNFSGEFSVSQKNINVSFSHINYETLNLTLTDSNTVVLLVPKSYTLEELVVSNISAKDYLKNIIKESGKKIDKNTNFKSYCREIVKINEMHTKYSDALIDYYVKKGNGNSNIILKQHRALKNKSIDTTNTNDLLHSLENNFNSLFNIKDYVKHAYNFNLIESILKKDDYEFEWWIKKELNGIEYEYINIIPNPKSDKVLYEGYVIIEPKSKSILEFKVYFSESHKRNSKLMNFVVAKAKGNDKLVWSKYKIIEDKYLLTYNRNHFDMDIHLKKEAYKFSFTSDIFIYDFENDVEIPKSNYNKKTIFEAGTNYQDEYWKLYNSFPLSKEEEEFINSVK